MVAESESYVCFDNVDEVISNSALARAITAKVWQGRILKTSTTIKKPIAFTWMATGNNIRTSGEMIKRCYRIRIVRKMANPEEYDKFQHSPLLPWIEEHRMELVAALLTLARAWYVRGKTADPSLPHIGGFEEFVTIIGGILATAGVAGFLTNMSQLAQESDTEGGQIEAFLVAWHTLYADAWKTSREVLTDINDTSIVVPVVQENGIITYEAFGTFVPGKLREALAAAKAPATVLSNFLDKRKDAYYGNDGYHTLVEQDTHTKKLKFKVELEKNVAYSAYTQTHSVDFSENKVFVESENDHGTSQKEEQLVFSKSSDNALAYTQSKQSSLINSTIEEHEEKDEEPEDMTEELELLANKLKVPDVVRALQQEAEEQLRLKN
jgi:hypothetical protein